MKKVIAKILCFALVMVMGFGVMSLLTSSVAAASSTPVVALRASDAINPILLLALLYLVVVVGMTQLLKLLERRLGKSDGK